MDTVDKVLIGIGISIIASMMIAMAVVIFLNAPLLIGIPTVITCFLLAVAGGLLLKKSRIKEQTNI